MADNPLLKLEKVGQSFWYDNISRELIASGELKKMIDEDGLRGITSNPTIFYKSIKNSSDYDDQLKALFDNKEMSDKDVFFELAFKDILDASDLLMPVYESTKGKDGFVSIEVDPNLAYNTDSTIKEALHIFRKLDRSNIMIKVPATREGITAIKELTTEGVNVNATLLFSVKRYEEVANAYMEGLQKRIDDSKPIDRIASVASFFVSRLDTVVDKILNARVDDSIGYDEKEWFKSLMGKSAIANAKTAYQAMVSIFSSEQFLSIKRGGGNIQRLLWASTSVKNPEYSDVMYVNELIGPNTINTMPPETMQIFKDHGLVSRTIDYDLENTMRTDDALADMSINIDEITGKLEEDGVKQFIDSFNSLIDLVKEKRG